MKLEFSRQTVEKYSNIKFHDNLSCGSRVVDCGRTDMTNLIVAFRNFANAPKMNIQSICMLLGSFNIYCRCLLYLGYR